MQHSGKFERSSDPTAPRAARPVGVTGRYSADMVCANGHRWRAEVVSTLNENGTEDDRGRDPENPTEAVRCPRCADAGHML